VVCFGVSTARAIVPSWCRTILARCLYPQLQRIKALFDLRNQLNPGKIATPANTKFALATIDGKTRGSLDRQLDKRDIESLDTVVNCNGNGQCFDTSADTIMCPSSKITRDRIHSPKGRASKMREWLRLLARDGASATAALQAPGRLLRPLRLWQRFTQSARSEEVSHQVYAMSGCLACQAYATQCPIRVDVPDFRAPFLELYHRRYARPFGDHLTATLERLLPWLALVPRFANLLMASTLGRFLTARVAAIVDAPALDAKPAARRLREHGIPISDLGALRSLPKKRAGGGDPARRVHHVLRATRARSCVPLVASARLSAARAAVLRERQAASHQGFLRRFGKVVAKNSALLREIAALGFPLMGIEPAVVLTYRDEYPKQLASARRVRRYRAIRTHALRRPRRSAAVCSVGPARCSARRT